MTARLLRDCGTRACRDGRNSIRMLSCMRDYSCANGSISVEVLPFLRCATYADLADHSHPSCRTLICWYDQLQGAVLVIERFAVQRVSDQHQVLLEHRIDLWESQYDFVSVAGADDKIVTQLWAAQLIPRQGLQPGRAEHATERPHTSLASVCVDLSQSGIDAVAFETGLRD